jgi:hypothetical protein
MEEKSQKQCKRTVYKAYFKPVLPFNAEVWPLHKKQKQSAYKKW